VALAIAGYMLGVPALRNIRRSQRRSAASTNAAKVGAAWMDAIEDLDLGFNLKRRTSETRPEFAERCALSEGVPAELVRLGQLASAARFGPDTIDEADVMSAQGAAALTTEAVHDNTSRLGRWLKTIDPTRLINSRRTSRANEEWVKAA
jgi:hypothetical protein